ncbi:MAG: type III secretion system gatekeeper subunit SctW [Parachlamydiales bacterium]|jgi:type III secretion protein W
MDINRIQAKRTQIAQQIKSQQRTARQVASDRALRSFEDSGFNIVAMRRLFKPLEDQRISKKSLSKSQFSDEEVEIIEETRNIEDTAFRFNKKNYELKIKTLLILRDSISDEDSVEDILRKVLSFYPDYTLADDALDFLLQTTQGKLGVKVARAKEFLNATYKREIVAGRNINFQAELFSKSGLGSPSALRDMYRDITGNPRTPHTLFDELSSKFNYVDMKLIMRFLFHSLGADLKAKGPSITRPELIRLIEDTQLLQAILGVYNFFNSRTNLVSTQFDHFGLIKPPNVNFENLSKLFINLLKEKYFSSEKILFLSRYMGISSETLAQIIVYTQMRDAIRQTSLKLYKSEKHRQEALSAFIQTLEGLEEKLEEEEEND